MRNRIFGGVVVLLLSVGLLASGCGAPGTPPGALQTKAPPVGTDLQVVTAEGQVVPARRASLAFKIPGRVVAIPVREGESVKQGAVLARLDDSIIQKQIAQAEAQLEIFNKQLAQAGAQVEIAEKQLAQADSQVELANKQRAALQAGGTDEQRAALQAALNAANANYNKVKQGPTTDELGQLQANLDNAKAAVEQAQAAYDRAGGASNPFIVQTRESRELQQATNAYKAALAAMNEARTHPTSAERSAAYAQILRAQDALAQLNPTPAVLGVAQAQVETAYAARNTAESQVNGARAARDTAQAQVGSAQAALDTAKAQAADALLVAPFDGTVAADNLEVGEIVQPGAPAFELGDLREIQVETTDLTELEIALVIVGQTANVTVEGLPDATFSGKVISIAPKANDYRGDQAYKVTIELPDAVTPQLRWGMTANVSIRVRP